MQDADLCGATLQSCVFTETFDAISAVAISPNGQYWAATSRRGEVRLWEEGGQTLYRIWQAHMDRIRALTFSPDGRQLVTGSRDGTVKRWDVAGGRLRETLAGHTDGMNRVAWSPDGSRLASCGDDGAIHIWDLESTEHLRMLRRDRPYERLNITEIRGVTESQKASLRALGAFEETSVGK